MDTSYISNIYAGIFKAWIDIYMYIKHKNMLA